MIDVTNWILAHHVLLAYSSGAFFFTLNLAIKVALYFHPITDWVALAQKNPRLVSLMRLSLALGINPVSVLQSIVDLVRAEASKGTLASVKATAISASKPLISPRKSETPTDPEIRIP